MAIPLSISERVAPLPTFPLAAGFARVSERIAAAQADHLGYPYNLVGYSDVPERLGRVLINNLGDPYAGSHYGSEVCDLEREAMAWLIDLWQGDEREAFWGSVGASGTEGNFWALYLAREAFPQARLLYSREAHYSIPKAARILRMQSEAVDCEPGGAIDIAALRRTLEGIEGKSVVLALTCGTTVKGAHDDIGAALGALDAMGFGAGLRFVHVDGALNAMVLPFVGAAPDGLQPSFRHGVDSISTSGHKMIGTAMPCGALVARRVHIERIASAVAYLRSNDTTLMGSRNGHAVLAMWARLIGHGMEGFGQDVHDCLRRAERLVAGLEAGGVPAWRNPFSLTVVFPQPGEALVRRYQLACNQSEAHAVVMPSVSSQLLERFTADYLGWWRSERSKG